MHNWPLFPKPWVRRTQKWVLKPLKADTGQHFQTVVLLPRDKLSLAWGSSRGQLHPLCGVSSVSQNIWLGATENGMLGQMYSKIIACLGCQKNLGQAWVGHHAKEIWTCGALYQKGWDSLVQKMSGPLKKGPTTAAGQGKQVCFKEECWEPSRRTRRRGKGSGGEEKKL